MTTQSQTILKSYRMGVSFNGRTLKEKRVLEREANQRVKGLQLQQENLVYDKKAINAAMNFARNNPSFSSKYIHTEMRKITNKGSNVTQSAYFLLHAAAKSAIELEKNAKMMISTLIKHKNEAIEWSIFGRSPRFEYILRKNMNYKRLYIINLVSRTRRQSDRFFTSNLKLNSKLPELTKKEIKNAIQKCYIQKNKEIKSKYEVLSTNQKQFLQALNFLKDNCNAIATYLDKWFNIEHKSRWKTLKSLSRAIEEDLDCKWKMLSPLRTIIVFALSPFIVETVLKILNHINSQCLINSPFISKKKGLLPLVLLMKHEYVVVRPGNAKIMTDLVRKQGHFDLVFTLKNHPQIIGTLKFSKKIRLFLKRGAKIKLLRIQSGKAPSYKIIVTVILEGLSSVFMSTHKISEWMAKYSSYQNKSHSIGIDVNRISEHMIAFSEDIPLPSELIKLTKRYNHLTRRVLPELHRSLQNITERNEPIRFLKILGELQRVYKRRNNIVTEIKSLISNFLASILILKQAKTLYIESLEMDPRNKKKAITRAIYNMPDDKKIFTKAVLLASYYLGYDVKILSVNPRGTSKYHNSCGGKLNRGTYAYDFAFCQKCGLEVNTHINAAKNIRDKGMRVFSDSNYAPSRTAEEQSYKL